MDAAIYARLSLDSTGEGLAVQRQIEDCHRKAAELGWTVADTYIDNDVSASSGKTRPEYQRLLADLTSGDVRALVVYDLDRLTRRMAELVTFMELHKKHGFELANVSGDVDLTTASGRMTASIKGAVAQQEAERIGERVARRKLQRAQSGIPTGGSHRLFGYSRDWQVIEDEAAVVVNAFERAAAGESRQAITAALSGVQTVTGGQWKPINTRRLLSNAVYAGINVYKGARIGATTVPSLVTEALFESAQNPSTAAGFNVRRYLLSGLLICDQCKAPMSGQATKGVPRYRCDVASGGCGAVSIKAEWVDGIVDSYMGSMVLTDYNNRKGQESLPDNRERIAELDERIAEYQAAAAAGELALGDAVAILKEVRDERRRLVGEDSKRVEQTALTAVEHYDSLTLPAQRAQVERYFKHIFVRKSAGTRRFDENRLYALMANGNLWPAGAWNVTNIRNPEFDGFGSFESPADRARRDGSAHTIMGTLNADGTYDDRT